MSVRVAVFSEGGRLPKLFAGEERYTLVGASGDLNSLLALDVDLFIVACSVVDRAQAVLKLLKATRALVLCESPVGMDASAVERLLEHGRGRVVVNHPMRFTPARREIVRLLRCGTLGELRRISSEVFVREQAAPMEDWRFDLLRGGGLLNELGAHLLDLVEVEVGEIISVLGRLQIVGARRRDDMPDLLLADEGFDIAARTEGGVVVDLRASSTLPGLHRVHSWYLGSQGALHLWDERVLQIFVEGKPMVEKLFDPPRPHAVLSNLVEGGAKGRLLEAAPSLEQELRLQRVLDATRGSAFQRMWNGVFHEQESEPIDLENPVL